MLFVSYIITGILFVTCIVAAAVTDRDMVISELSWKLRQLTNTSRNMESQTTELVVLILPCDYMMGSSEYVERFLTKLLSTANIDYLETRTTIW